MDVNDTNVTLVLVFAPPLIDPSVHQSIANGVNGVHGGTVVKLVEDLLSLVEEPQTFPLLMVVNLAMEAVLKLSHVTPNVVQLIAS